MSVGSGFDPSREWLGIDAVDLADPFRALGLAATEADPAVVTAAAERLLARLRDVAPGPFRLAHESLRKRIEACREEVLAVVATRPRPAASGTFVPPPLPPGLATSNAGGPPAAGPMTTASVPDADAAEPAAFQLRRSTRRAPSSSGAAPALVSLLAVVAGGVAAYVLWPNLADAVRRPRQVATRTPLGSSPTAAVPQPVVRVSPQDSEPASTPREPSAAQSVDAEPIDEEPVRPRRPPRPRPAAEMETGTAPDSDRSEPIPFEPAPPQPSREQRARAAKAVKNALDDAYAAIRSDQFDTADARIAAAARLAAEDDDLNKRILSWQQFSQDARAFIRYREQALDAANAGGDYAVRRADGSMTRISVIESTPEKFVYRSAGRNMSGPRSKIPPPILTAIVREWFAADGRPANSVFLGVHLLTKEKPNLGAVRQEWDRARQGGADVSNLEPLLDDPIIRAAAAAEEPAPGRGQ
jgi:hypothetical protein